MFKRHVNYLFLFDEFTFLLVFVKWKQNKTDSVHLYTKH